MASSSKISEMAFAFSLSIISLYKELVHHKEYILSKQLLRSATSIGANVEEASAGQSKKDFIAKMSIASMEARETRLLVKVIGSEQTCQFEIWFIFELH